MSVLKIAIVLNCTWNIVNFRLALIKALIGEGHEVFVISPRDSYICALEAEGIHHLDIYMDNNGISPLRDLRTMAVFFSCYAHHRFDLVLHYTIKPVIYGGAVARLLNIPAISTITGLGTVFIREGWITRLVRFLYRFSLKKSHHVFFQNADDMTLFLRERLVHPDLTSIVPGSGINTDHFSSSLSSKTGDDDHVFLLVARMLRDKGVNEFVDAARLVKNKYPYVRFQLLGPVDVENNTAISQVVIDGWCAEGVVEYFPATDDVRCFIEQASCVVLPSYREGLPRTLLEAAAMMKPLVATDVPGCRDVVINDVNGYLCDVADANDLAEKMEAMINLSLAERITMGEASRRHVIEHFDEKRVIDCYLREIKEVNSRNS